jgi:hypothetical protein
MKAVPQLALKADSDRVSITERRFGYFPAGFVWRGQLLRVLGVTRCWMSTRHDLVGRPHEFHHFRVSTARGTLVLTHDLHRDQWTVAEAWETEGRAAA